MTVSNTGLMILLSLLLVPSAQARRHRTCGYYRNISSDIPTCKNQVRQERESRLKNRRRAVYDMYKRSPSDLCVFSSQAPGINGDRCQKAVGDLHQFLDDWKERKADRCESMIAQKQACNKCADNLSVSECNGQAAGNYHNHRHGSNRWKNHQRMLAEKIQAVEDALLELSDAYAQNLKNVESDVKNGVKNSQAAARIGATSPSEALQMHGNESYSTISGMIDQIRNAQDIGKQQIGQIERIKDNYAAESLYLAATAKSARTDMEQEVQIEDAKDAEIADGTKFIEDNNKKLVSINQDSNGTMIGGGQSSTSQNLASAIGGAAAGSSAGGAVSGAAETASNASYGSENYGSESYGSTYDPRSSGQGAVPLNPLTANAGPGAKAISEQQVAALTGDQAEESGEAVNASGASVAGGSLRDALRAKMAAQASGNGGAVGASTVPGAKGSEDGGKAGAKALSPEKTALLTEFQPTDYSGGEEAFEMAESETEAAVQEMISEFQGEAQIPGIHRGLASSDLQQLAPEILSEDSSSLFLRTSEFYTRCLKRGCVAR